MINALNARTNRSFLRKLGFQPAGTFALSADKTCVLIQQPQTLPEEPGVYAFLLQGKQMVYVGQTTESTLRKRVGTYERPHYHQHRKVGNTCSLRSHRVTG